MFTDDIEQADADFRFVSVGETKALAEFAGDMRQAAESGEGGGVEGVKRALQVRGGGHACDV